MINWAIRYQPILHELQHLKPACVLEVGSGSEGLQLFWRGKVVGIDLEFKRRTIHEGVIASGLALPIAGRSCPVVVCCDMLEHVCPDLRRQVVNQLAQATGETLLLTFPCGEAAERMYRSLAAGYRQANLPSWLAEHLKYRLPDPQEIMGWLREMGWHPTMTWYESISTHKTLLNLELKVGGKYISYSLMRIIGPWLAPLIPIPGHDPKLRVLIKAARDSRKEENQR